MEAPVRAPEIARPAMTWFNVAAPLSLADLRGRIVILDFWTFCCINCMHVLPSLHRVEQRFPDEVAVIGVHSPKFFAEREPENVAAAIARYGISHPVVHDPNMTLWREYAVRAWPTLVFLDPEGYVIGQFSGEPDPDRLIEAVGDLVEQAREHRVLEPAPLLVETAPAPAGRLAFPGKIKALPGGGWAITDAGHHRIVVADEQGGELARYGSGQAGFADGAAGEAMFRDPQGLVADTTTIYVADTGNHAVRAIDRASGRVMTLAGTGRRGAILGAPASAAETALASPWDLEIEGGLLYVANAGSHQLGVLDLAAGTVARLAGNGAEALVDGEALEGAALAQPSGLALDRSGRRLFFADSEISAARVLDLERGEVTTLVGAGLFDFGHKNGSFGEARLQHALGLAWSEDGLIVADSYNRAVRLLDLENRQVSDIEPGLVCQDPVCLPLGEPAGIAVAGDGRLLLADTNNHRILELNPAGASYRTWMH
jgi:thiol-disulfide isomerase/thioredoxin